jgi:tryptophan synthase alpha chain
VAALSEVDAGVPLVVMTYYNVVLRGGHRRFARSLVEHGVSGAIVPDLPLDEFHDWGRAADDAGVETILLAAPTTPDDRLVEVCARCRGWVYGVGLMGVTGERSSLAASATTMAKRLKAVTDLPVLIGVGVSTPEQAVEATAEADGVIVGSALVRRLLEGGGPEEAATFVGELRSALDGRTAG